MINSKSNYNLTFDILKGFACIFVVFMHCEFSGVFGIVVQCISRFSVPVFFVISGYFSFYSDPEKEKPVTRKALKTLTLLGEASVFYILFQFYRVGIGGILEQITLKSVVGLFLFNLPIVVDSSLWFLLALIYTYLVFYLFKKLGLLPIAEKMAPFLLIGLIILGQGFWISGIRVPNSLYRNFLFEGFPFFMIGYLFHKYYFKKYPNGHNTKMIAIAFVAGTGLSLLERYILGRDFGVHIGAIIQTIALVMYAINKPQCRRMRLLRIIGNKYSQYIYIFHRLVMMVLELAGIGLILDSNIKPIIVLLITLIVSIVYVGVKNKIIVCIKVT